MVEETCASGAYYIAVAADEIYADKASLIGSIGVVMDGFDFTGTMDKLGVRAPPASRPVTNKGIARSLLADDRAQKRAYIQAMLDQIHQPVHRRSCREGRGTRLKETPETF